MCASMFKRLTVLQCREDVVRAAALERWLGDHRALVRSVPGVVEYVQRPATYGAQLGSTPTLLGIGEVAFRTRDDAEAATASAQWQSVIDDASEFAVLPPIAVCWVEE